MELEHIMNQLKEEVQEVPKGVLLNHGLLYYGSVSPAGTYEETNFYHKEGLIVSTEKTLPPYERILEVYKVNKNDV